MRQAGRTLPEYRALRAKTKSFWDMCFIPDFTIEATLQPVKRFDIDAAILFSDILTVPKALGQTITFESGVGPVCDTGFLEALPAFCAESFVSELSPIKTSLTEIRRALPNDKTLIGFVGGPFTVASYMVEGTPSKSHNGIKTYLYKNPEAFGRLIDLLTDASIVYVKEQIRSGADVIQVFESWAGLLPPAYFEQYVLQPVLKLVAAVKQEFPTIPVIVFPRGAPAHYEAYVSSGVFEGLTLDHQVDLASIRDGFSQKICFQGGIDPAVMMAGGHILDETIFKTLDTFSKERYICNLSHGLDPLTPVENIAQFVESVRRWDRS